MSGYKLQPALLLVFLVLTVTAGAAAQDGDVVEANDPVANLNAVALENHYSPALSGGVAGSTNRFELRYTHPVAGFLVQSSLPVSRVPVGLAQEESGLGDLHFFVPFLIDTGTPTRSLGIGPVLTAPSATEDSLGSGQWQAGLAGAFFDTDSSVVQWGGMVSWQTDFAGDDARAGTHSLEARPLAFLQLGNGLYARSAPEWVFDIESGTHRIPLSLGLGKIVSAGSVVYNVFVEPQFTILDDGPGQPEFQLLMGLNMQFR